MSESPADRAGQPAQPQDLVDVAHLVTAYYTGVPDPADPAQRVTFGTSGHRGSSLNNAFNETHILATTQAICDYRRTQGYDGPLFVGRDTHGLSEPAWATALEVLAANDVTVLVDDRDGYTPTPAVSHAILRANHGRKSGPADGIVVTPSHNPPSDGGFKYNPPHGGPADSDATSWIADAANEYIEQGIGGVRRFPFAKARAAASTYDFLGSYIDDLPNVVDLAKIKEVGVRIGADPLGGASVGYWGEIADRHGLDLTVVNPLVDATWRFMTLDWDGKIRMDCSSPSAMASLIEQKDAYQIATGNDADADRHGIVTPDGGLMNPNHYLAVAINYLYGGARPSWPDKAAIGKTLVSSSMIDRVAELVRPRADRGPGRVQVVRARPARRVDRVRRRGVGGRIVPALRRHGVDHRQGRHHPRAARLRDPGDDRQVARRSTTPGSTERFGDPAYARVDAPADRDQKAKLAALSPDDVTADSLAGEDITAKLTEAPGNGAKVGGLKVTTENAWFAARPSGTEDVYKIYAESFRGPDHLKRCRRRRARWCPPRSAPEVSAVRGCLERCDVELAHLEHRGHRALRPLRVGVGEQLVEPLRDDLPRQPPAVLAPPAGALLAAVGGERRPVAVDLLLVVAADGQRDRLVELELRSAVEHREGATVELEGHRHHGAGLARPRLAELRDVGDPRVREERAVELRRLLSLGVEPKPGADLVAHGVSSMTS